MYRPFVGGEVSIPLDASGERIVGRVVGIDGRQVTVEFEVPRESVFSPPTFAQRTCDRDRVRPVVLP